jgi:glycosyltransferase involved in cell wall biosynthesis
VHLGVADVPVDRAHGRRLALEPFDGTTPERVVALVGRLDPQKGQEELLRVAPSLLERVPDTGVLLVGGLDLDAPYPRRLRALVEELELSDSVRILPFRPDVRRLLAGVDLLVHASVVPPGEVRTEGFPLVALEAMHAGTPVVGYANGGLPELVGETGVLVETGDREGLAVALAALLSDDERRARLGDAARERVLERFTLAENLRGLQARWREAARSG